ncbi:MAG: hypothetical protein EHM55_14195 [Acidobacteria bacterium]|nr:MAG: hypothetical protein EHM55_14195 [Acidobacteriota bacterium]
MKTYRVIVSVILGVLAAAAAACSPPTPSAVPVVVNFPVGDVAAGRQAFLDLKCTTCHRVPSEPTFPAPVSANPGPALDQGLANRDFSYLATAVMSPSHTLSPETSADVRAHMEGTLSPMGDFSRVMTVRQLVDLHSYLRAIK